MLTLDSKTKVPVYTLEQSSVGGIRNFEITDNQGCAVTPYQKGLFFVPHRRDYYTLVFVRKSVSRHWVDMVPFDVKADTLYFSSPQQVLLKEESHHTFTGRSICFTEEFLDMDENKLLRQLSMIQNPCNGHELILNAEDVAFIDDISSKLLSEYDQHLDWRNGMLLAYLRVLLIYVSRLYTAQYNSNGCLPERDLLKKFKALILDHFTQHHDVSTYAGMLNLSAGHFSEMIKEQSGKTAIEHIHDRLLLEAKRMLFHTEHSVKEIAYRLGFEDASYFNRFFKQLTSDTPLHYRTTIREKYH